MSTPQHYLDDIEDDVSYMQRNPRMAHPKLSPSGKPRLPSGLDSDFRRASLARQRRRRLLLNVEQFLIVTLSSLAIGLLALGATDGMKLSGCIAGIMAAPLVVRSTWSHRQWGLLTLALWFGVVYLYSAWRFA